MRHVAPNSDSGEFTALALSIMRGKGIGGDVLAAAEAHGRCHSALEVLRSASPGMISAPTSAGALAGYTRLAAAFVESLVSVSVFDALRAHARRVPLRTRIAATSVSLTGREGEEGATKEIEELELEDGAIEARKASALVVLSDEVVKLRESETILAGELRKGVARATDRLFLGTGGVLDAATAIPGTAGTPNVYHSLRPALRHVVRTGMERPFLVMRPTLACDLATAADGDGRLVCPDMRPDGGYLAGVEALVSDQAPQGDSTGESIAVIDATSIVYGEMAVTLDSSRHSLVNLEEMVSLWQRNLLGLLAERYFGFQRVRSHGAAIVTGIVVDGATGG